MKLKLCTIAIISLMMSCTSGTQKMDTSSMEPTITKGEKISIEQAENLKRQDIVAFNYNHPALGKKTWVFRIIGVPGDTIEIKQGAVYINGKLSEETYTKLSAELTSVGVQQPEILGSTKENNWNVDNFGPVTIPLKGEMSRSNPLISKEADEASNADQEYYFLLGDSRHDAYDSRFIGFIPKSEIVGVVRTN